MGASGSGRVRESVGAPSLSKGESWRRCEELPLAAMGLLVGVVFSRPLPSTHSWGPSLGQVPQPPTGTTRQGFVLERQA